MMQKLAHYDKSSAWCLCKNGEVYDVYVHPYGAYDMDAIEDAAWLYLVNFGDKDLYVNYIADQFIADFSLEDGKDVDDTAEDIELSLTEVESIQKYPELNSLVIFVIKTIKERLQHSKYETGRELELSANKIKATLNNNFLRVRYGSLFQTFVETPECLYFRISSDSVNWCNQIFEFVLKFAETNTIKDITIGKDMASTGSNEVYLEHIPFNDFLFKKHFIEEILSSIK